jgi:zinc transport system substrate-binding protein
MNSKSLTAFLILIFLIVAGIVSTSALFAANQGREGVEAQKIRVVVTINPYVEFVKKVGGERVDVVVLVPQGADPHTFDLTPSTIKAVSDARIYFKVGAGLEFEVNWLDKLAELNPNMLIVDTSAGIELIGSEGHYDPHIWLSPRNAIKIVNSIYQGLVQIDPDNVKMYKENHSTYINELEKLDNEVKEILSDLRTRVFIVHHPAWTYFARDYNLRQIALEEEGKEATVEEMIKIIKAAKAEGVKAVFTEPQFDTRQLEVIAKELNVKIVPVDPLYFQDYVTHIKSFAYTLKEVLS